MCIQLHNLIPNPLIDNKQESDIWGKSIVFSKENSYSIIAASGIGKTSLIHTIFGLRNDYSGELILFGKNAKELRHNQWQEIRKRKISIVPQSLLLFNELTVKENIHIKNRLTAHLKESEIQQFINQSGLHPHENKKVAILSHGQKQRLSIIRALCQPFQYILLDEAFSHLDNQNKEIMRQMILEAAKKQHAGIVFTSVEKNEIGANNTLFV
jgi:putative ABC transport system ATP-binding protein